MILYGALWDILRRLLHLKNEKLTIAYFSCLLNSTVQNCEVKIKSKDNVEECICIHF